MPLALQCRKVVAERTRETREVTGRVGLREIVGHEISAYRNGREVFFQQVRIAFGLDYRLRINRQRQLRGGMRRIELEKLDELLCFRPHVRDERGRLTCGYDDDIDAF